MKPSHIAGAAILSAVHGLYPTLDFNTIDVLAKFLRSSRAELQYCRDRLDYTVEKASKDHNSSSSSSEDEYSTEVDNDQHHKSKHGNAPHTKHMSRQSYTDSNNNACYSPMEQEPLHIIHNHNNDSLGDDSNTSSDYDGYETPNDINDINFTK